MNECYIFKFRDFFKIIHIVNLKYVRCTAITLINVTYHDTRSKVACKSVYATKSLSCILQLFFIPLLCVYNKYK